MSAFIPIKTYHNGFVVDAIQNVDHIIRVWKADYRDDMGGECFYWITDGCCTLEQAAEPYESLVAKILAATAKEEREKSPHTPLKEKEEAPRTKNARARGKLTCDGFAVPQIDDVKAFAATIGIDADTAEEFWYNCDATGWKHKGSKILNWRSMLQSWYRARKRFDMLEAARTAHIDAKMDEREAKRERRTGGGRKKADNNVEMSDEVREEVRRDFTF